MSGPHNRYQSQYFAWPLSRQMAGDSADILASTLVDAQVDLNPHQVDAALFAFRSPLSKGVILADEVGLGKTIEAGLVIAQRWAERKRRILIVVPANLRKQWHQELQDKFSLQASVLEAKSYRLLRKEGLALPFDQNGRILICSYQFAKAKADELQKVPWDLVVMDEAHRLRNVYKPGNVIGKALKEALAHAPKVLLTATPLQNTLLELYGVVSLVDERVFGDLASFRDQFSALGHADTLAKLRARLSAEQFDALSDEVGAERSLLVCCSAWRGATAAQAAVRWPNLTVKKIPKMVKGRCEWGHDDYSLNVANLPMAQKPQAAQPVQDDLFGEGGA